MPVTPEQLEEMSVLELVELKKALEERWGVSAAAAAPVMVAPVRVAAAATVPPRRSRRRSTSSSSRPARARSRSSR